MAYEGPPKIVESASFNVRPLYYAVEISLHIVTPRAPILGVEYQRSFAVEQNRVLTESEFRIKKWDMLSRK